jgi:hypothetical protein
MKDSRVGECLWSEWTGVGQEPTKLESMFFFTVEHVDLEHDVVRRALASALQRDGSVVSLGHGYGAVEGATTTCEYAGYVDGDNELTICNSNGETYYGDVVDEIIPITLVEI